MNTPLGFIGELRGYQCLVFLHELGHFSVVLIRPTADPELKALHDRRAYEAACDAVPVLSGWTDPGRARPTSMQRALHLALEMVERRSRATVS